MSGSSMTPLEAFTRLVRVMQIVVSILGSGCLIFLSVVFFLIGEKEPAKFPVLSYCALAVGILVLAIPFILPRLLSGVMRNRIRQSSNSKEQLIGKLVQVFMMKTVMTAAMLESVAILATIAYLIDHSPYSLAIAVVLIVAIFINVPTRTSVVRWIDEQMKAMKLP